MSSNTAYNGSVTSKSNGSSGTKARPTDEQWRVIWFRKLAGFCKVQDARRWRFSQLDVVNFLIDQRKNNVPTWKRIKITESLLGYSKQHFSGDVAKLEEILMKLRKLQREEPSDAVSEGMC